MAKYVSVDPEPDGHWVVTKDGSRRVRAFDRKDDAVERARIEARRFGAELVVKDRVSGQPCQCAPDLAD
jgi:Uncharacterized protein conserved in bacteria (DUF2188)